MNGMVNQPKIDHDFLTKDVLTNSLLIRDLSVRGLSVRDLYQPAADSRPTVFSSIELFEYQLEPSEYNTDLLDESFSVRSPGADYSSSDTNDLNSSLAVLNGDAIGSTFLIKPLQLLNLLAEEDVTLYEAADILRISVHTANKYVAKIKSDFGVLTLPAAVLYAVKEGLISKSADKTL